jgi:hypothetical protein
MEETMLKGVNWIAVIVAVVLLEVLGFLWYGPLFGQAWMAAYGGPMDETNVNARMAIGVVNTLIAVLGLAWLTVRLGAVSLASSVGVALAAWFFFDFTTQALEHLYMGMNLTFVGINMGYQLVSYVLTGAVLALVKFGRPKAA